jgi:hypothetical protein
MSDLGQKRTFASAARLSELRPIFSGDFIQLLLRSLCWCRGSYFPEQTFQSGRCDHPEQEELTVGVLKAMPGILRNENRRTLLNPMVHVVENKKSATLHDVEGLVHFEVSVDWNASADQDLLGSHGEAVGPANGIHLDEYISTTQNEMFALSGAENITLWHHPHLPNRWSRSKK